MGILSFHHRSTGIEIMDDLECRGEVVDQTLRELDFINQWLGGNAVTINAFKELLAKTDQGSPISVVDLGCGSGEMLRLIARLSDKVGEKMSLIGIDANPNIIDFAKKHSTDFNNIQFEVANIFSDEFKNRKFDIVLCTLFLHHFSAEELVIIFKSLKNQALQGVVINDIHRHPLAYYSIKWLTQLFSKSAMVKFDAPLSVLRAFTKNELKTILHQAGINHYELKWKWAFRWQLIIKPS